MGRAELTATPRGASSSAKGLHLAVCSTSTTRGGAEIVTGYLLEQLRADIDVTVIGTDREVVDSITSRRPGSASVLVAPIEHRYQLRRMLAFRRAITRLRPDVLQFVLPWTYDARWEMLVASTIRSVAVVAVEHSQFPLPTRRAAVLKRWVGRRLDTHVAVSASIAREVTATIGADADVRVIHNGVPVVPYSTRVSSSGRVLGTIARLDHMKGIDVLLRALADVADARVIVVGSGPDESKLHSLAAAVGVADRVEWTGWTERAADQLARFDVFVLPSRSEGLPLTICEAMLARLPVVASRVGGIPEVVVDGTTGLLVAPDDPSALADALTRLLADPELCARMGEAGRDRATELFTATSMAVRYEALYDELVTRRTTSTTKPRTTSGE